MVSVPLPLFTSAIFELSPAPVTGPDTVRSACVTRLRATAPRLIAPSVIFPPEAVEIVLAVITSSGPVKLAGDALLLMTTAVELLEGLSEIGSAPSDAPLRSRTANLEIIVPFAVLPKAVADPTFTVPD